jgi:hypothetical protein
MRVEAVHVSMTGKLYTVRVNGERVGGRQMGTDDRSFGEGADPATTLGALDDEGLLAALREVLGRDEAVPDWSAELAKSSYGLRAVDAELAALTSDSGSATAGSGMRSGTAPRLAVFEAGDLSFEIEIEPSTPAGSWRLVGQLTPASPARIQIRQQGAEPFWVEADELGRFAADHLAGGSLSLMWMREGMRAAVTEWIAIS